MDILIYLQRIAVILIIFFQCCFNIAFAAKYNEIIYNFKKEKKNKILINMEFQGSHTGKTIIYLPNEWAGQTELYKNIKNIELIASKEAFLENTTLPYKKKIIHKPKEKLTIQYEIIFKAEQKKFNLESMYIPIINENYFHFIGHNSIVFPAHYSDPVVIKFNWQVPTLWSIANSYGINLRTQSVISTIKDLKNSLYTGGMIKASSYEKSNNNNNIWFTFNGVVEQFNKKEFIDTCSKIIKAENNFWHDFNSNYYLINMVMFTENIGSFNATSLHNAFTLFIPSNLEPIDLDLIKVIAHEYFHKWNSAMLFNNDKETEFYWFTEGFTDYYSNVFLLKQGVISIEKYVDDYNSIIMNYYLSPVRNISNENIEKNFWKNYCTEKLPYQRGNMLAHNWNTNIRLNTKGIRSLCVC